MGHVCRRNLTGRPACRLCVRSMSRSNTDARRGGGFLLESDSGKGSDGAPSCGELAPRRGHVTCHTATWISVGITIPGGLCPECWGGKTMQKRSLDGSDEYTSFTWCFSSVPWLGPSWLQLSGLLRTSHQLCSTIEMQGARETKVSEARWDPCSPSLQEWSTSYCHTDENVDSEQTHPLGFSFADHLLGVAPPMSEGH